MKVLFFLLSLTMFFGLLVPQAVLSQSSDTIELAFLVDGSGSISSSDFTIMKNGIADAIENPNCVPHNGRLELTIIQFSGGANVEVAPTSIDSQQDASSVAQTVRQMGKLGGGTNYAAAFDLAVQTIHNTRSRQTINITTDGQPSGTAHIQSVQNAIQAGFDEIDAEGIGLNSVQSQGIDLSDRVTTPAAAIDLLRDEVVYPQPGSVHPPQAWPPSSPGWVRVVSNATEFADTVCQKFKIVINTPPPTEPGETPRQPVPVPEPVTIILFGTGLAGLAGIAKRRRNG